MHAFILAGGFATRLWPLTEKRAKPLLPIAGKPILTHLIEKIPRNIPVTVSTNAAFRESFHAWREGLERNISIVIEETKSDDEKLGALGATAQWIEHAHIDEDLLLLTGDNYLGFSMDDFLEAYETGTPILAAFDIEERELASGFGTVLLDSSFPKRIIGFEEKPNVPKTSLVSTGCSVLPKDTLSILSEFARAHPDNIGGIFEHLLSKGRTVHCFTFREPWLDIGSFSTYLAAHRLLVHRPLIGAGSTVQGTEFLGSIAIGSDCRIEKSSLRDTMVFDRSSIEDCVLRDCVIDDDCVLRGIDLTGKMIRAGTILKAEK